MFHPPSRPARHGFTLVEMSLVLVIIGLLVGGILAGEALIRSSQLRSVVSQYSRISGSVSAFRDKYQELPGDMMDAGEIWGLANNTPSACITATGGGTCNGDGDQFIEYTQTSSIPGSNESFRFWQQLSLAGFYQGSFTGVADGSNPFAASTKNSPSGKLDNSLWFVYNKGIDTGGANAFAGTYNNSFMFGAAQVNSTPSLPILKAKEAAGIDTKVDDGLPATGKVVALGNGGLGNCTDTTNFNNMSAQYLLSNKTVACALFFRQQF